MFTPRVGIELFRGLGFSLMFEAGFVEDWNTSTVELNGAALIGVRI
jgi:hypothetical protein